MSRRAIGTLYVDDEGVGSITMRREFTSDDALYQADVLRDIVHDATQLYNTAVDQIWHELDARREHDNRNKDQT